jgi:ketosteroid isomerase-like protein
MVTYALRRVWVSENPVFERLTGGDEHCYRGIEGVRQLWSVYRTEFEDFEVWPDELRDADEDRAVLVGHTRWRGPASGIETESPFGMVITVRNGKIVHSMDYLSHEEALEAVGGVGSLGEHRAPPPRGRGVQHPRRRGVPSLLRPRH